MPLAADVAPSIHSIPPGGACNLLASRPEGLTREEAADRLRRWGPNVLRKPRGRPLYRKLLSQFTHLMALLLWVGGFVAFLAGMPQIGVAVLAVNLVNGAFGFWQEHKAEKAAEALRRILPQRARVRRDGGEGQIPAEELVRGDILVLSEGDHVSADARVVEETELRIDQSTLTGESHPVRKTREAVTGTGLSRCEFPNLVFAGTTVAAGNGVAIVFATGMDTEFGKIAGLTEELQGEKSPLQREMERATRVVSAIAVGVGAIFFSLSVAAAGMRPGEGFVFALGMIVAFVPEGLLPTVTLSLAMGVQRMARRKALVKRLSAVETLGCTSVICTDKTGTLTQNAMTVREIRLGGRRIEATGTGYGVEGKLLLDGNPVDARGDPDLAELLTVAALCNNSRLLPLDGSAEYEVLGDPTEAALRVAAAKGKIDGEALSDRLPRWREIPFDSRRKRMATIHREGDRWAVFVKGAPGEVLQRCTRMRAGGKDLPVTEEERRRISGENDEMAHAGLRVLALAGCRSETAPGGTAEEVERDLTFLGLAGMMDPPRPEVAEAVAKCHRAGIRIVMVTGDYGLTAESVARRIGILHAGTPRILNGTEMDRMDERALEEALRGEVILARVAPEHKLRAVSALQRMGHVVAVTGDGVNDAPALKKADIGVAMGIAGTDVAKEAADMVLADDNFASIVSAVEEGRAVYDNIKKFIGYIFTSNTPEAVPFILFAFSGGRIPLALNILQILSIDLGTDLVPALALGAEPPEPGIMDRPPRKLSEHAITPGLLLRAYLFLGLIQSAAAMAAFYFLFWTTGYAGRWAGLPTDGTLYRAATSMTLAAVVVTQVGNLFAQRTARQSAFRVGWCGNRLLWAGIATEIALLLLIVYVPALQGVFGTAGIPLSGWLFLLPLAPALFIADEARKALLRRRERTDDRR
ncbi:MAG TPA: ATPase [Deltaproteobacteria bacterium]|nr:ATPase [Deltaproteobacteria bacterium]HBG73322.1 ATPase [Deltaproteobacteria bacterium]